jgi:hypothetical protein
MAKKIKKQVDGKQPSEAARPSKHKNKFIIIGIIAAVVASIAYVSYRQDSTIDTGFATIDGIPCETQEYLTFHVHAHLDIFVGGDPLTVPAGVGIPNNACLYYLHTHTPDGVIHIESPKEQGFTLGQFFDIWRSTSTGFPPANEEPVIHVNGNLVTTKLNDTPLHPHDEIVLVYGNPPATIPAFYQFPEGE